MGAGAAGVGLVVRIWRLQLNVLKPARIDGCTVGAGERGLFIFVFLRVKSFTSSRTRMKNERPKQKAKRFGIIYLCPFVFGSSKCSAQAFWTNKFTGRWIAFFELVV